MVVNSAKPGNGGSHRQQQLQAELAAHQVHCFHMAMVNLEL